MIKFQSVNKVYPCGTVALDGVSFEVQPKEFVSIVGKSGSGKTTLLKLLMAEERPTGGHIFLDEQDVHRTKRSHLPYLRRKIGAVFQDYKLLPSKTAYENVAYVMEVMGASEDEIQRDVPEVLEVVGLGNKAASFPRQLSGGEKQRVAIARALIHRPEVILADEPTGDLDPYNTADIVKLLLRINELGTVVLLATHNKGIINSLGRRVLTLEKGKLIRDEENGKFRI